MERIKICLLLTCISLCASGRQPGKLTQRFFPDPGIAIHTPSFLKKKGYADCDEVVAFIRQAIRGKAFASLEYIGTTQRGRQIPAVVIRKEGNERKVRILLTGRIHGDEPAGTEALLMLVDKLLTDTELETLTEQADIAILPMVNIDGGEKLRRQTDNGIDANRDMTKLQAPETIALRQFFNRFAPDVMVDFHEYNPFRVDYVKLGSFGVTGFADVMMLYCEHPDYPQPLAGMARRVFLPAFQRQLTDNGLSHCKYFSSDRRAGEIRLNMGGASPRSSVTAFGLSGAVTFLMEIRGAGLGKTSFTRRVYSSYLLALAALQTACLHRDSLLATIREAQVPRENITVTFTGKTERRKIPFIDIEKNEMIEVDIPVRDAAGNVPDIVRKRPFAYALLPAAHAAAATLNRLGIAVDTLKCAATASGEIFRVEELRRGVQKFEGFYEQFVRTAVVPQTVRLPEGTFIVRTDQKRSAIAAVTLEPEAENGFVRYCVLPVSQGDTLPVYRILNAIEQ